MRDHIEVVLLICTLVSTLCQASPLPLQDVVKFPDQTVAQGQSVDLSLPPLPQRGRLVPVLNFRAVIVNGGPGGCNWNMTVLVNGHAPTRYVAPNVERLLGRASTLELTHEKLGFSVFNSDKLMVMFAKDADQGDSMTTDGLGATFSFDLTGLARGVDVNTITFRNNTPGTFAAGQGVLAVTNLKIGYLDRAKLPKPVSLVPRRGLVAGGVTVNGLKLAQSIGGGFVVRSDKGPDLLVETGLGMKADTPSSLVADDKFGISRKVRVMSAPLGSNGYKLTAEWKNITLQRTLKLQDGLVLWHEEWINNGEKKAGVPFRHRFFLRGQSTEFWIGGSLDNAYLACSPCNPTLYLQPQGAGTGLGVTAESDWLRLLAGWRGMGDVGEIYSDCLALGPQKSIVFDLTITPAAEGGYWSFINKLRQRWGSNRTTMQSPMFWGFTRAPGDNPTEAIKRSLGNLGPVTVVLSPWQRLEPDCLTVTAQKYSKLPQDAPRAAGACPDLDVPAFLTWAHRGPYWQEIKQLTDLIHQNVPQAKVIEMTHPAMECVYKPAQERWPIAPDAIKTAGGQTFEDAGYSKIWLGEMVSNDWGVLYYCPHEDGPELSAILAGMVRGMDEIGLDGMYADEFSWAFNTRAYSRYDYSRTDGYSADLDEDGKIVREKCDNAFVTEQAQLQMAGACLKRHKFFLGNGGNVLRSIGELPIQRFIEGGNGTAQWGQGHLSAVPLVLGNMGDEKTLQGVFDSVRLCLQYGSIYSPTAVNLLLEGPDNFVCKQYPITIEQIGPGFIIGKERIITTVSRPFDWRGASGRIRIYRWDKHGVPLAGGSDVTLTKEKALPLTVPDGGLVIAEKQL